MLARKVLLLVSPVSREWCGKGLVLTVTYLAYAIATAARLPYSIAKTSLRPSHWSPSSPGWSPFTEKGGEVLLGTLDTIFMAAYAGAMPIMGATADRVNQTAFLAFGLLSVGIMLVLVGMAHEWSIHFYVYFAATSFLGGCFQSICYPCAIGVISKWCGKANIGLILGVWSSCTPMGTIVGKLAATAAIAHGWQWAFFINGMMSIIVSCIVVLCLVADPHELHLSRPGEGRRLHQEYQLLAASPISAGLTNAQANQAFAPPSPAGPVTKEHEAPALHLELRVQEEPVPLIVILRVPGMISYCVACFFSKLAYYAFMFWLPFYLVQAVHYDEHAAGNVSTFFDWGGFTGGILGGVLMDRLHLRGVVLLAFQSLAGPMLTVYIYLCKSGLSVSQNNSCLFFLGFTVTTPYSLITSVMAADLGRHPSLKGNSKAAAAATGILDGTGSLGAVVQGVIVGWFSKNFGWDATFFLLALFAVFSTLCLIRPSVQEIRERRARHNLGLHWTE